jgi:phosphoribosylaminoimidazole carboxylase
MVNLFFSSQSYTNTHPGSLLINEIAPRPHNSGHYTIEACETSQYENHLRAILGLPLGSTNMKVPSSAMLNLLGPSSTYYPAPSSSLILLFSAASSSLLKKSPPSIDSLVQKALTIPGTTTHLYGKPESRPGRKMGHITIVGTSDASVRSRLRPLLLLLNVDARQAIDEKLAPLTQHVDDDGKTRERGFSSRNPLVGIVMGSDSDLPVMRDAAKILDGFGVEYELSIVSAHRTPNRMVEYTRSAVSGHSSLYDATV